MGVYICAEYRVRPMLLTKVVSVRRKMTKAMAAPTDSRNTSSLFTYLFLSFIDYGFKIAVDLIL